jgi:hypothetical protein
VRSLDTDTERGVLRQELSAIRADFEQHVRALRTELWEDIRILRSELTVEINTRRKRDLARWTVIVLMSQAALLLGALYFFSAK